MRTMKMGLIAVGSLVLAILFLILFELGFRGYNVFFKGGSLGLHRPSLCCGFRVRANYNSGSYVTDDRGFRKTPFDFREFPDSKVYKIVALGDSATFGSTNSDLINYPAYLEYLLNETALKPKLPNNKTKIDVINAGVMGYNSRQTLSYLKDTILDLDPDLVVVSVGNMDLTEPALPLWRKIRNPLLHYYINFSLSGQWLIQTLSPPTDKARHTSSVKKISQKVHEKDNVSLQEFRQNTIEIVKLLKERNILPVLMPWSFAQGTGSFEEFDFNPMELKNDSYKAKYIAFTNVIIDIAKNNNIPLLHTPFQTPLIPKKHSAQFFMASKNHLNNGGAQIMAFTIAKSLQSILKGKINNFQISDNPAYIEGLDLFDLYFKILEDFEKPNSSKTKAMIQVIKGSTAKNFLEHKSDYLKSSDFHFTEGFMSLSDSALYLIQNGNFTKAKIYLDEVIRRYPKFSYGYFIYGILYYRMGSVEASVSYFEKAKQLNPFLKTPENYLAKIDKSSFN